MTAGTVLSVGAAAVAAWLIGALWYSPLLFAKAWVSAHGYTPERIASMRANAGKAYGGTLIALVLIAGTMRILLNHLGVHDWIHGALWGFHVWLGFAFPLGLIAHLYSDKSWKAFLIDTAYQLVYLKMMGAILGAWG